MDVAFLQGGSAWFQQRDRKEASSLDIGVEGIRSSALVAMQTAHLLFLRCSNTLGSPWTRESPTRVPASQQSIRFRALWVSRTLLSAFQLHRWRMPANASTWDLCPLLGSFAQPPSPCYISPIQRFLLRIKRKALTSILHKQGLQHKLTGHC